MPDLRFNWDLIIDKITNIITNGIDRTLRLLTLKRNQPSALFLGVTNIAFAALSSDTVAINLSWDLLALRPQLGLEH